MLQYPKDVAQLSNLTILDLTKTNISYIPPYVFLSEFRHSNYFDSGPSNYPNVTVLLNNTPVSKTLDWSNEFRNFQPEIIEKMSYIFPNLEAINLAGNEITSASFPPLFLFPQLKNVDASHNLIASAPWVHLDMLEELDVLNLENNQLPNVAMSMIGGVEFSRFEKNKYDGVKIKILNGGEKEGLTCGMLERLRRMRFFSVDYNFVNSGVFGKNEEIGEEEMEDSRERWYFENCPQGPIAVMKGAVAAATFILPHVILFSWSLKYCSTALPAGTLCLSTGEMSISRVLAAADPDKLGYLRLKKVIWRISRKRSHC